MKCEIPLVIKEVIITCFPNQTVFTLFTYSDNAASSRVRTASDWCANFQPSNRHVGLRDAGGVSVNIYQTRDPRAGGHWRTRSRQRDTDLRWRAVWLLLHSIVPRRKIRFYKLFAICFPIKPSPQVFRLKYPNHVLEFVYDPKFP